MPKEGEFQSWSAVEYNLGLVLYGRKPQKTDTVAKLLYDAALEIKKLRECVEKLSDPDLDVRARELNEIRRELLIKKCCVDLTEGSR
jgi:hypothetical protein